jgi:hypothetical protein
VMDMSNRIALVLSEELETRVAEILDGDKV